MKKITFLSLLFIVVGLCFSMTTEAAIPHLINYQGRLTNADNMPLNGSYDINFKIYDAQSAGNLLWQETHAGVVISEGLFSVLLGAVSSLNLSFDIPYYLEIKVGTEVMSPRQMITSAGYAIRAEVADSVPSIDPGLAGTKTVDESAIADGKVLTYSAAKGKIEYKAVNAYQAKSGFCFGLYGGEIETKYSPQFNWVTFYTSKPFTKTPGLNTITFSFYAKTYSSRIIGKIRMKIVSLTSQEITVDVPTKNYYGFSLDVSSLTDGETYNIELQVSQCMGTFTLYDIVFEHS